MTKQKTGKYLLLDSVRTDLVFPNTGTVMTERALLRYLEQLDIKVVLLKVGGEGHVRRHITAEQAEQIVALFKAKHWRKFKLAKETGK